MLDKLLILLICVALPTAPVAAAAAVVATKPDSIVKTLQDAGYQAKLDKDKQGDPLVESASSGSKFWIYFYGCTKNLECKTVQFYTSYDAEAGKAPSLEKINKWNLDRRFGTALLDESGDSALKFDVDLEDGGKSPELFTDNLEYWISSMAKFEEHIGW